MGVNDLVVIESPEAVLVADRSRCQDLKVIVAKLQTNGQKERTRYGKRPFG